MGAVDGIHIPVMVGVDEQGPFRNKNGMLSQNVLAACSFDLKFHYVLAGWEGSASDLQVLNSALTRRNKLQNPEGILHIWKVMLTQMFLLQLNGILCFVLNSIWKGFAITFIIIFIISRNVTDLHMLSELPLKFLLPLLDMKF